MKISVDLEEIEMLIDFQESMANDADESCEHDEAKRRRQRVNQLKQILRS